MPLIQNEQEEKAKGQFIKLEDKAKFVLLSNMYKIDVHFLPEKKMSVLCQEENCNYCKYKHQANTQYYYYASVNTEEGVVRIPASVFFQLNENERLTGKDKRSSEWYLSKKGEGINTKYTVAKGDIVEKSDVDQANEKLGSIMIAYEGKLQENYKSTMSSFVDDEEPKKKVSIDEDEVEDIPFA